MAGTSCLRTASAQASRRALIWISSVLVSSDMASCSSVRSEDERGGVNPTRARDIHAWISRARVGFTPPRSSSERTEEQEAMSEDTNTEEIQIKALLEAWADAVRRHDVPAILARHDPDIV